MSRQDENEIQFVILLKQDDTIIIHSRASLSHTRDKFWPILWAEIGKVIKMSDENFAILKLRIIYLGVVLPNLVVITYM